MEENQVPAKEDAYAVPWSIRDTWLGVYLLILLFAGMLVALWVGIGRQFIQTAGILIIELIPLLPILLIFAWRRIRWKYLGFGIFNLNVLWMGIGLLFAGYVLILLHNVILSLLGIDTQGDQIIQIFDQLKSPAWFLIVGAVVAPLAEEIFFRGFLFQGFRQKYGWFPALLLSSAIFGAAHLSPVSFIPTFILGCVLAYMYHRSNSLWPGILFHAAINSLTLFAVYMISKYPGIIPS